MSSLFPNEKLIFRHLQEGVSVPPPDKEINDKYSKGDVRIVTEQARYPLSTVPSLLASGNYKLNPEFQRRHRWDRIKQSQLMESFIMNVPIPPIFLYEDRYSHYEVMDGLQRLTAIREFYDDKFSLEGLQEWGELNGRRYSNLPELIRRGIDRRYLSSIILLQETAKEEDEALRLKQLVFERINSGGIKLEAQEARNAIYNGPLNQLCIKEARNIYLCRTWGIPEPDKAELEKDVLSEEVLNNSAFREMQDVELVLRFFAYRQRIDLHRGAQRDFFDNVLKYGNLWQPSVLANLQDLFERTIKLAWDTFGEKAFWLWRSRNNSASSGKWDWFSRPTTVIYDPLMFVLSQHLDQSTEIVARRDEFQRRITTLYEEHSDEFAGRFTNKTHITDRNVLFDKFINDTLQDKDAG